MRDLGVPYTEASMEVSPEPPHIHDTLQQQSVDSNV